MTDFKGPHVDDYGRVLSESPEPIPEDLVFVGEVWSGTHAYDPDHMDPNLSYDKSFLEHLRRGGTS